MESTRRLSTWALIALSGIETRAAIIHVPGESPTIQGAIDAASAGDIVIVHPGTYVESLDFLGKRIVVTGTAPRDPAVVARTVVDAEATEEEPASVVTFASGEDSMSVLAGLTLRGGVGSVIATGPQGGESTAGGGVICQSDSSPRLAYLRVLDNRTIGWGGSGAGLYCRDSSPTLKSCTISENDSGVRGGGLSCEGSSPRLELCTVTRNSGSSGGGFHCDESSPKLLHCTVARNSGLSGGGLCCRFSSSPILTSCTVANNSGSNGGGLYCGSASSPILTSCTIAGNSVGYEGGGLYCFDSSPTLAGCTLTRNSAFRAGGGLLCRNASPSIINSILWNDAPREIDLYADSSFPVVTYSDVHGEWEGEGNIDADPRFCDATCGQFDDPGLASDSPCLGSGFGGADMGAWGEACWVSLDNTPAVLEVPVDYANLRDALDAACDRDTIVVAPGIYAESGLEIPGFDLVVRGWDPHDPEVVAATVIEGGGEDVLLFSPTPLDAAPVLAGVTITGGARGISCNGASPRIDHCTATENLAASYGGGIYCHHSSPTITGSAILRNSTSNAAGGLYCVSSHPVLSNCTISENTASNHGGGFEFVNSTATITNCSITDNHVSFYGGGCYVSNSSPIFTNCTIAENSASRGGGLDCNSASLPVLENCILWNDTPEEIHTIGGAHVTVSYSNVDGGWEGEGNIDADPDFRSVGPLAWLLGPGSPSIDAGDPTLEDGIFDWHPRWPHWYPNGPRSDMGAYGGEGNAGWLESIR